MTYALGTVRSGTQDGTKVGKRHPGGTPAAPDLGQASACSPDQLERLGFVKAVARIGCNAPAHSPAVGYL